MKKILIPVVGLLGILVIIMVWVSTGSSKSPSEVVTTFYELANEGEFSKATEYVSGDLIRIYEMNGKNMNLDMAKDTHNGQLKNVEMISENINGELAMVKVKLNWKDGTPSRIADYHLTKENGEWKIAPR
ncbi:DUF4878 domain-containing protein [Ammoniphilus sp. 3BR4]|uniref:DUF4878 domain-containing protein n=1 Tax=Ammoniphilus sp. 3BR4 TaxID=3158265 RepID=UPI0034664A6D